MRAALAVLIALACLVLAPAALADSVASLSFSPNPLAPNGATTGTVTLSDPAAPGGETVTLSVAPASAATVPATVTVPEGQTSAEFPATDLGTADSWTVVAQLAASNASETVYVLDPTGHAVINEVDYDQPGSDTGEFVEVFNPTASTIDLHHLALAFINGATNPGTEYLRVSLAPARCLPPGSYVVVADDAVTVPSSAGVVRFTAPSANILNANADGVALVDSGPPALIDGLWYQGHTGDGASITGFPGPVTLVEGTPTTAVDSNSVTRSLDREPNGKDTDDAQNDWAEDSLPSPGSGNGGFGPQGTACEEHAPTLDPIGGKTVEAGKTLSFTISGSDPDAVDEVTYSATNLPAGATFDSSTGQFTWTPATDQVGTYPSVHFSASDGTESDAEDVTISVTVPPVQTGPGGPTQTQPANPIQTPPGTPSLTLPDTGLGKLRLNWRKRSATLVFSSNVHGVKFLCKLDRKRFAPCRSPKTYKHLKPGRHTFQVKATDSAGTDATPAVKKFKIKR